MGERSAMRSVLAALGGEEVVALAEAGGLDRLGDVEDVVALGDGEGDGVDVAADEAGVDLGGGGGVVEAVLAGFELAAFDGAEEVEGVAAADDSGGSSWAAMAWVPVPGAMST